MKILKYVCSYTVCFSYTFPLIKPITILFESITTHCQTLHTWIGHNGTRYHKFNALPHALPHTLPYIFSQFSMVSGLFATGYQFCKKNVY